MHFDKLENVPFIWKISDEHLVIAQLPDSVLTKLVIDKNGTMSFQRKGNSQETNKNLEWRFVVLMFFLKLQTQISNFVVLLLKDLQASLLWHLEGVQSHRVNISPFYVV